MALRKARARMLSPTVSSSIRLNRCGLNAALLYTWMIAHADDQGRLSADPDAIKILIVPLLKEFTVDEIRILLKLLDSERLIRVYTRDGDFPSDAFFLTAFIQLIDWWDFQVLRDPQPSKYPAPPDWEDHVKKQTRDDFGRFSA